MHLKKEISKYGMFFAAIGGIVGSGWLFGPMYAAKAAGPAAIISWVLGGVLMMVIAFTFAELSTAFPVAGGIARFVQFSHGRLSSFTLAWVSWLAALMVAPIETMAAMQYAGNHYPDLVVMVDGKVDLTAFGIFLSVCVMLVMCVINCLAVRFFSKSNSVIVNWKLLIPFGTCFFLLTYRFHPENFTHMGGFAPMGLKGILHALPTAGVIFSFIGYSPAIQLAAEAKDPARAIPFAIIGAVLFAICLYVLIQVAFIGALTPDILTAGWSALHFEGDAGPVAGIVMAMGAMWLLKVIYIDAVISPIGTAYIYTASTARINIAMTQNGYMPELMKRLNRFGSPVFAIMLNFFVGMLFFLPFPGWQEMVSFIVSCFVIAYAIGPIACTVLREKEPDVVRPFRLPCVKTFCVIAFMVCNLIVYWTGWEIVWKMLVTVAIGYLVLVVHDVLSEKSYSLDARNAVWLVPYLLGLGVISYLGSFGGLNIIKFGYDFIVIGLFSVVVFFFAIKCALDKS